MSYAAAASAAIGSLFAANAARDAERAAAVARQEFEMSLPRLIDARERRSHTLHPGDCSSCGSQEFRRWHGVSVCSYCRSVADAPTPARPHPHLTNPHPAWGGRYYDPLGIIRPHAHARLTTG